MDATWITFNDENQNEKGGITAGAEGASISFDYAHSQGITLATQIAGAGGSATLTFDQMPDPSIPLADLTAADMPRRVLLGTDNVGDGALLSLNDSQGRPRILLQVDGDDVPRIQILAADGSVVSQLPPQTPPGKKRAKPRLDLLARASGGLLTRHAHGSA